MVGWQNRLNGHGFDQSPGDSEIQGSLAFCSTWGRKELDTTKLLNNNDNKVTKMVIHACETYARRNKQ